MNIRQKLAELRNLAREGATVDAAELVALQTQVAAEEQIAELAAEGERTRAEERAAREHAANIATAQNTARDLATSSEAELHAAYDHAVDALEALIKAADGRHDNLVEAVLTLGRVKAPAIDDPAAGPVAVQNNDTSCPTIVVDGRRHFSLNEPGEFIRCAVHAANYRFRDRAGSARYLRLYGGNNIMNKLGTPDWTILPEDRKP